MLVIFCAQKGKGRFVNLACLKIEQNKKDIKPNHVYSKTVTHGNETIRENTINRKVYNVAN